MLSPLLSSGQAPTANPHTAKMSDCAKILNDFARQIRMLTVKINLTLTEFYTHGNI
jgi:hypothetical protein